jgi:hypothetical protein
MKTLASVSFGFAALGAYGIFQSVPSAFMLYIAGSVLGVVLWQRADQGTYRR